MLIPLILLTSTTFLDAKYIKNYDGDTITVDVPSIHPFFGKGMKVRLAGVDTPEIRTSNTCEKEKAEIAKNLVKSMLSNAKVIELRDVKKGKFFRVVADVYYDGNSLSKLLLNYKLAVPYHGGKKPKTDWCKD